MINNKLVSVIIPTYNSENYILNCIQSVLNQTYNNFEIIIVDNQSTDQTIYILNGLNDKRIKLFNINNNGIIAASRNLGLDNAKGDFIAFLDSDDLWDKNKLEISIDYFTKYKVKFIYHNLINIDENGNFLNVKTSRSIDFFPIYNLLIFGNCIWNSSVIFDVSILTDNIKINESVNLIGAEDFHFWLQIIRKNKIKYIDKNLGFYMVHENATSLKVNQKILIINIIKDLDFICAKYLLILYINFKFLIKKIL